MDNMDIFNDLNKNTYIPSACRHCNNHPSNGGTGFCNCILGDRCSNPPPNGYKLVHTTTSTNLSTANLNTSVLSSTCPRGINSEITTDLDSLKMNIKYTH